MEHNNVFLEMKQNMQTLQLYHLLANALTKAIDQAFRDKDIRWIEEDTLITCDEDFLLEY